MPMEFPPILETYDNPETMRREIYYEGDLVASYSIEFVMVNLMHKYIGQPAWGTYNKLPRNKLLHTIGAHPQASGVPSENSDESPSD